MNYKEYQTIYEEIKQKKLYEIYIVVLEQRKQLPMREESIKELSIPFTKEKENVQSLFHSLEQNGATPEMLLHVILLQKEKELAIFTRLENGNIFDLSSRQNYVDLNQIMITDYVKASDLFQEDQARISITPEEGIYLDVNEKLSDYIQLCQEELLARSKGEDFTDLFLQEIQKGIQKRK